MEVCLAKDPLGCKWASVGRFPAAELYPIQTGREIPVIFRIPISTTNLSSTSAAEKGRRRD